MLKLLEVAGLSAAGRALIQSQNVYATNRAMRAVAVRDVQKGKQYLIEASEAVKRLLPDGWMP